MISGVAIVKLPVGSGSAERSFDEKIEKGVHAREVDLRVSVLPGLARLIQHNRELAMCIAMQIGSYVKPVQFSRAVSSPERIAPRNRRHEAFSRDKLVNE